MCTACFSATDDFYDLRDQADDLHRQLQNEGNAREAVEREVEQVGRSPVCVCVCAY